MSHVIDGVGIDVVEIPRMQQTIDRWGEAFLNKILTASELEYTRSKMNPTVHIAGRFAVKEAVSKALRTGWSGGFRWKDVEVTNDPSGKPSVTLQGKARELLKNGSVKISISHSDQVVVAIAIIHQP